ncbi:SpoIIIAH-like family protein [Alkaliphilus oremlandii]|uniref:Putative stage III sporulation protein AH n=1 Tax=Alkaliphilus oremlandii (strain OhILAs) TaxID=350688 RepID=A8MFJ5_ALKOO|nr:SpoIIIAH-like family protein [Alkaliphilus oremlandii]ABW19158.1 putative stage III sporulation protein AH [Alkaliphilus oremlandii OhILAs]
MKLSITARKNFIIFSLVLMLGVISYANYSLNQNALLETSSELERYELSMMEEYGLLYDTLDGEAVFNSDGEIVSVGEEEKDVHLVEQHTMTEEELSKTVVDSTENNKLEDLVKDTNIDITETVTSKSLMKSSAYFIEGKLTRDKKRSEMISSLDDIITTQNTSKEIKDSATNMKLNLISNTEKEVFIENMIMAKGFNDAIVYLSDQSINIVVSSDQLEANDVAKIVDIVKRETNIPMDQIIIMGKK